jgi:hypothetical protein
VTALPELVRKAREDALKLGARDNAPLCQQRQGNRWAIRADKMGSSHHKGGSAEAIAQALRCVEFNNNGSIKDDFSNSVSNRQS